MMFSFNSMPDVSPRVGDTKLPIRDDKLSMVYLYHLVSMADGDVSAKEVQISMALCQIEGIDKKQFESTMESLRAKQPEELVVSTLALLKQCDTSKQINSLAWATVVANCDGFMSNEEFALLYRIYHAELKLDQKAIMARQAEIHKVVFGRGFVSMGVKVN
ncbi:MAG: TerB family tellurite resistance protein [Cytophagales bacterium]|nr:TerB family tellurite resistance protein [Cytophagales bacterium]